MAYDPLYREVPDAFGAGAEDSLKRFAEQIPEGPALDLGAGQGRNALYLARAGREVVALEPSAEGCAQIAAASERDALPLRVVQGVFQDFEADPGSFAAVLAYGLVQILPPPEAAMLSSLIDAWLAPGGLVFATAFLAGDESASRYMGSWERIGPHAFADGLGEFRSFLEPGELPRLFPGYRAVFRHEGLTPYHQHGRHADKPHRHLLATAVMRKPR